MVEYKCKACGKEFDRKSNFEFHVNRKFPCVPSSKRELQNRVDSDFVVREEDAKEEQDSGVEVTETDKFRCQYCLKSFSTNSNYNRHINKNCKQKKLGKPAISIIKKDDIINRLKKELESAKDEIKSLKKQVDNNSQIYLTVNIEKIPKVVLKNGSL